ncbi:MAG: cysteine--tRNA ligase [Bacilli bacterium]|nr:cysteine--tRNA ligase [Bacilli bacterium]
MKLYNTLTRKVEEFIPHNESEVTMYTCGPTVYHYAHIGNLRTYIMEDILEKTLKYVGYNVKRCMNITDVGHLSSDSDSGEDKMLKGAKRENKTVLEIAKMYTEAFYSDLEKLNIRKPDIISPATENISEYFKMINTLLDKGYAYIANGNVYFDVSKLEDYYVLTNHKEDEMVVGAREGVEEDPFKKNQADFVLWFTKSKFDDQELKWDSPWGVGYPGWHIECSGISLKYLGEYLDIHCGGVDNIFPHHTNEIAQTESTIGHKWCKYWVHGEHLNDKTGKMSKSKGEFLTVSLLEEKGYDPIVYRFMCLQSHYRKQLLFSYESLDNTKQAYEKLKNRIKLIKENIEGELIDAKIYKDKFKEALENDMNTSDALTALYDVIKSDLNNKTKLELIKEFDSVLSLRLLEENEIDEELKKYIETKLEERAQAKKDKDFTKADLIRDELESRGILIKDTREGTTYQLK